MVTLERSLKSKLTENDLKVLHEILRGFDYYKGLAERLSWFNSGFDLKQFYTLYYDFRNFYNETIANDNEVLLYYMGSFIKSFKSLLKDYDTKFKRTNLMYRDYLIDCIVSLALMVSDIVNEMQEAKL